MFEVGKTYRVSTGGFRVLADSPFANVADLLPGAIEDAPAAPVKTLWDEYAMAALTGMLAGKAFNPIDEANRIADALMAERERRANKEPRMTTPTTLEELAKRVEGLTGPCRETDAFICVALGLAGGNTVATNLGWCVGGDTPTPVNSLPYTASLDAAMTLVPEGWTAWQLHSRQAKTRFAATLSRPLDDLDSDSDEQEVAAHAATPALALTAAALRAKAAQSHELILRAWRVG